MMIVRLTYADFLFAGQVATLRATSNLFKRRQHRHGAKGNFSDFHFNGALAEYAAAKALGMFWPPPLDDFDARDVGGVVDVRSTEHADGRLILHPDDDDETPFVLAHIGELPDVNLSGWILGRDAKQTEWWADPSGKGRPAYFVPKNRLRDVGELTAWLREKAA